jgi:ankyrin repeat protein
MNENQKNQNKYLPKKIVAFDIGLIVLNIIIPPAIGFILLIFLAFLAFHSGLSDEFLIWFKITCFAGIIINIVYNLRDIEKERRIASLIFLFLWLFAFGYVTLPGAVRNYYNNQIKKGDLKYIKFHHTFIIKTHEGKCRLLHNAAPRRQKHVVKYLLDEGCFIDDSYKGKTPLQSVASYGLAEMIEFLLENGADIHLQDKDGNTALFFSVRKGKCVELLLRRGADPNIKNNQGRTPLFTNTISKEVYDLLIEYGANYEVKDNQGCTPLHTPIRNKEVVLDLIEKGLDVNSRDNSGKPPIYYALDNSDTLSKRILLENGADIKIRDKEEKTLLHYAVNMKSNQTYVSFLLKEGIDANSRDIYGRTPLHYTKTPYIPDRLIENGADVNAIDNLGRTPLHYAAISGSYHLISPSCRAGADPFIKDNEGMTPKELALKLNKGRGLLSFFEACEKRAIKAGKKGRK